MKATTRKPSMAAKKAPSADFDSWTAADKRLAREIRKRQTEHMNRTKPDSLAVEFGITYDKACFLLKKEGEERELKRAKDIVNKAARGVPFMIEDLCDEDD